MAGRKRVDLKLKPLSSNAQRFPKAMISFWPQKRITYLWVGWGGNEEVSGNCIGTISGAKTIEKFARALLAEVTYQPKPRRSR